MRCSMLPPQAGQNFMIGYGSRPWGLVAELVDAVDSKSTGLAHLGSTPSEATT
jgi:hypothetical protein